MIVEDLNTGKTQHACSAYFTFVTLKRDGQKIEIANLVPGMN